MLKINFNKCSGDAQETTNVLIVYMMFEKRKRGLFQIVDFKIRSGNV